MKLKEQAKTLFQAAAKAGMSEHRVRKSGCWLFWEIPQAMEARQGMAHSRGSMPSDVGADSGQIGRESWIGSQRPVCMAATETSGPL